MAADGGQELTRAGLLPPNLAVWSTLPQQVPPRSREANGQLSAELIRITRRVEEISYWRAAL